MKKLILMTVAFIAFQINGLGQPPAVGSTQYFRQEWVVKGIPQPKDQIDPSESASITKMPIRSYPYYNVLYGPKGRILSMNKYLKGLRQYSYEFQYDESGVVVKVILNAPKKSEPGRANQSTVNTSVPK